MGGFLRLGIWEQTATYLELKKVGGKGPSTEATRTDHGEGRKRWACDQGCRATGGRVTKESERLVSGNGGDLLPPRAGLLRVQAVVPHPPRVWGGDVTDPRGLDPLSHYEFRLDVRVDFRLPDGVLEVEAQASSLTGATSAPAAAAVTAASFAAGGPVVGTPSVPPRLPPQAFLLQQELEAFHFAACGSVLCLPQTVSRGFAHSDLALALEQGGGGSGSQLLTGGSFWGEVGGW